LDAHAVRQLGPDDVSLIRQLFAECADFFELIHGDHAAEADQIFDDVPLGKRPDDKLVFGISIPELPGALVGLVELLRDFPTSGEWCLGLLLFTPRERGHGLGGQTADAVARFVERAGGKTLQLLV